MYRIAAVLRNARRWETVHVVGYNEIVERKFDGNLFFNDCLSLIITLFSRSLWKWKFNLLLDGNRCGALMLVE